jgi:tetratricopeptide (TPR) repeat protein
MLAAVTELSFVARLGFAALQTPPQESKWLPEFVHSITLPWWIVIGVAGLVLLVIILYYFTIDEIELAIPPKIKFKRRVGSTKERATASPELLKTRPTTTGIPDTPIVPPTVSATIQPNLVHPYPLQANFTGRVSERNELTAWLADDEHPIYELVAMGGMGKSALSWVWLTRDVIPSKDLKLDGVMWWSFYEGESSFAKFIDDALKYVSDQPIDAGQLPTTYDRAQELRHQLQTKRVLFVLDGFERQLRAYASLDAAYKSHDHTEPSVEARSCVDPISSRLLRDIAAVTTRVKVLLTSRLTVSDIEDRAGDPLAGVIERELKELSRDDAIVFMRAQGVKKGTDAEIANVCEGYGYHALSLRLLSGLIARDAKMPGDIAAAPRHQVFDALVQRQHHVLEQSYDALPKKERALLSRIAAFRSPMAYDALAIFNTLGSEQRFDDALENLRVRGLLQHDSERFDLHPIVRHYAYERLTDKTGVHTRLRDYFAKIPAPEITGIQSIEDLASVIELFYHTVRSARYLDAAELLRDRLLEPLYFRFCSYETCIELLRTLFPGGEGRLPGVHEEAAQGWILNSLAISYGASGQPRKTLQANRVASEIAEKLGAKSNVAVGLGNVAQEQLILGELAASKRNVKLRIELAKETNDENSEAIGHRELGRLLVLCGAFDDGAHELDTALRLFEKQSAPQSMCVVWSYLAMRAILMLDVRDALKAGHHARMLAEKVARISYPVERDFIRVEWLLGAGLVMEGKDPNAAAAHLTQALTRCRRINLVETEPNIMLSWARWHRAKGNPAEARAHAEEALAIADRCEYRLNQADIHNLLARLALDAGDREEARKEAETAKERAWCDGPPHCYKPALDEAEKMLKELETKE